MKKNMLSRCFALSLAALMSFGSIPTDVFATVMDDGIQITKGKDDTSSNDDSDDITIEKGNSGNDTSSTSSDDSDDIVIEKNDSKQESKETESETDGSLVVVENGSDADTHVASSEAKKEAAKQDFSSKELIVKVSDADVVVDANVSGNYEDVYLMEYDTEAEAKQAFMYYYDNTSEKKDEFVASNAVFGVATNDDLKVVSEDALADDIQYDKDTTSLDELADAVKSDEEATDGVASLLSIGYTDTIAMIDTGAADADVEESVSMLGEDTTDTNGHGTEMVKYMKEVNKDVHVLSIKALDGSGRGDAASIYAAIEYAISKNVKVINLSLYGYNTKNNAAIVAAIKDATDAGITVVGAAGNGGNDVKDYLPGNIEDIIVVGACDKDGKRIATSNYGKTVDYNVVADSTSEATARMSAFVALNGVAGIDDALNQGMIYATDYEGEDVVIDKDDNKSDVEIGADGSIKIDGEEVDSESADGFASALALSKTDINDIEGYHYTLNRSRINYNNSRLTAGTDHYELGIHNNQAVGGKAAGVYHKTEKLQSKHLKNHTWYALPGNGFTVRISGGARSSMGLKDLDIVVSNIQVRYCSHIKAHSKDYTKAPLWVLVGTSGHNQLTVEETKKQPYGFKTQDSDATTIGQLALRFNVEYRVVGAAAGEKLGLRFADLDQEGCNGSKRVYGSEVGGDGYKYGVEGIETVSGIEHAWVNKKNVLSISNSNTRYYSTTATGGNGAPPSTQSSVSLVGNASGMKFKWSGTNCGTGMGGFENDIPVYTVKLHARYQNADGSWGAYSEKVSDSCFKGQAINISWTDTVAGYGNISAGSGTGLTYSGRTAHVNIGSLQSNVNCYVSIPRSPVTGRTYVRYQDAAGNWSGWGNPVDSKSVSIGGTYSYTYTKPNDAAYGTPTSSSAGVSCNANGATVSKALTADTNFYISVPRVQRTYSFNYNLPKAVTDSGYNESSLRTKGYLTGTQNAFTKYHGATANSTASISLKGYTFKGWNTNADGSGSWYTDTDGQNPGSSFKTMTADRTFYAIWQGPTDKVKVTVKVRYQGADGNFGAYSTLVDKAAQNMYSNYSYTYTVADNQRKAYASRIDVERESTSTGNNCSMSDNDSTTATVGITEIIRDETFLISVYRRPYTVKTEVRYEQISPMSSNQIDYSGQKGNWGAYSTLDTKSVLYEAMYNYNYNQIAGDEWGTSKCTTTGQTGKAFTISEIVKDNKTYQVEVPRARYKVIYDPNGSQDLTWQEGEKKQNVVEGTMADSQYIYDLSGKLRPNAYTRAGYEFVGWNTKADGTGTAYKDNYTGVLKWAKDGESVTLYAQWKKKLGTETLTVVSEETGKPVSNVVVQLYKNVNGKDVPLGETMTTDASGKVVVNELHWFDYTWKCVSVPSGYEKFKDIYYGINYDHLKNEDSVILSMKHVKLTIDSTITEVIKGEHAPSFTYHVEGIDAAGVKHSYNIMVDVDGNTLKGSNSTKDMFAGNYKITQIPNERYIADPAKNVSNSTVSGINATANLLDNTSAEVEFPYHIYNYGWFTSMHSATNKLTK